MSEHDRRKGDERRGTKHMPAVNRTRRTWWDREHSTDRREGGERRQGERRKDHERAERWGNACNLRYLSDRRSPGTASLPEWLDRVFDAAANSCRTKEEGERLDAAEQRLVALLERLAKYEAQAARITQERLSQHERAEDDHIPATVAAADYGDSLAWAREVLDAIYWIHHTPTKQWAQGLVFCPICDHEHRSVHPVVAPRLECPTCGYMIENPDHQGPAI